MPTKSTGCATCRKRKIRCDETRPACKKCGIHGVACPGYRQPQPGVVVFEDQTALVVRRARKDYAATRKHAAWDSSTTTESSSSQRWPSSSSASPSADEESPWERRSLNGSSDAEDTGDFACIKQQSAPPTLATAITLHSVAIERLQLYGTFLYLYIPRNHTHRDQHFGFLTQIATSSNMPASLAHGLDAVALVQVGSIHHDPVLLARSVKSYSQSLASLARALSHPRSANDDGLLATVTILALCEFFDHIASTGAAGWSKHMDGAQQLLSARGPESIRSPLAILLYGNKRHASLSHGLISRKACVIGRPEWRAVAFRDGSDLDNPNTIFYDTALQIPALLEDVDAMQAESEHSLDRIDSLLAQAQKLESELQDWYLLWSPSKGPDGRNSFHLVPIEQFTTFAGLISDRTIDAAFYFSRFGIAYALSGYWNCLHFLRTTVQQLHKLRHQADPNWYPRPHEVVDEEEIMELTMNLCRAMPYFTEPESSSIGQIGMFLPVRTATLYFVEKGQWKLAKWVGEVRKKAFLKGMSPPRAHAQNEKMAIAIASTAA